MGVGGVAFIAMGGLITSALLTRIVLPVLYAWVHREIPLTVSPLPGQRAIAGRFGVGHSREYPAVCANFR
jgi:hypothetical protein